MSEISEYQWMLEEFLRCSENGDEVGVEYWHQQLVEYASYTPTIQEAIEDEARWNLREST